MSNNTLDGWYFCLLCNSFWSAVRETSDRVIVTKVDDRDMDEAFHSLTPEEQLDMVSTCPECDKKRRKNEVF